MGVRTLSEPCPISRLNRTGKNDSNKCRKHAMPKASTLCTIDQSDMLIHASALKWKKIVDMQMRNTDNHTCSVKTLRSNYKLSKQSVPATTCAESYHQRSNLTLRKQCQNKRRFPASTKLKVARTPFEMSCSAFSSNSFRVSSRPSHTLMPPQRHE